MYCTYHLPESGVCLPGVCSSPQGKAPHLFCNSRLEISGHTLHTDNKRWVKFNPVVLKSESL
jgi:hypothetical protein